MFCPKCGNEIVSGTRFCKICGAEIHSADVRTDNDKPTKKKHIAGKIIAIASAGVIICAIGAGLYKFYNDPYWQLLYSINRASKAGSFSFTLNMNQIISAELPIISKQTYETNTCLEGNIEYDVKASTLMMRAESEDEVIFLYVNGNDYQLARRDNREGSQWETESGTPDEFENQDASSACMAAKYNTMAQHSSAGITFIGDAFKSRSKLSEYSDLTMTRQDGTAEIEGKLELFDMIKSLSASDAAKNPFYTAFSMLLGGNGLNIEGVKSSDSKLYWKNSRKNLPSEIHLDYSMTADAAELLSSQLEENSGLQDVIGFLNGYISLDVDVETNAVLLIDSYNEAEVYTDDIEDIIDLD